MNKRQAIENHPIATLFASVVLSVLILTPFAGGMAAWREETGAIEVNSFLIWMLCPIVFVLRYEWRSWVRHPHVIAMTLLLGFREAPFDVWIVDERLLKPEFYANEGVSLTAVVGGAIAIFVLASVVTFSIFGIPAAWRAYRTGLNWPVVLGFAVCFALVGQTIEEWFMQPLTALVGSWLPLVAEEASELVFAVLALASILLASSTFAPLRRRTAIGE